MERNQGTEISQSDHQKVLEALQEVNEGVKATEEQAERYRQEAERYRQQAERYRQQAERDRQLRLGTFYATFDQVWEPYPVSFSSGDYNTMIRDQHPAYKNSEFFETMKWAKDANCDVAGDDASSSSTASSKSSPRAASRSSNGSLKKKTVTWPVHVLESRFHERNNNDLFIQVQGATYQSPPSNLGRQPPRAPIAHLVPASKTNASLYHHVAIWVFGKTAMGMEPITIQKLIHGSKKRPAPNESVRSPTGPKLPSTRPLPEESKQNSATLAKRSLKDPPLVVTGNPSPSIVPLKRPAASISVLGTMNPQQRFRLWPQPTQESKQNSAKLAKRSLHSIPNAKSDKRSGSSRPPLSPEARSSTMSYSEPAHVQSSRRKAHTGLKHMVCNKIRLGDQVDYFDKLPCLVIVPVLSLTQAKAWRGQGYDAIFMISTGNKKESEGRPIQTVAGGVAMLNLGEEANSAEIDVATGLLTATIKGLALTLNAKSDTKRDKWASELSDPSKNELNGLQGKFTVVDGQPKVMVPVVSQRSNNLRVLKITFAPAFGPGNNGHPAPDPILLAVKAAVNWSWFHEQKLIAGGEIDESDSEMSECSIDEQPIRHEEIMEMGEIQFSYHQSTHISSVENRSNRQPPSFALEKSETEQCTKARG